MTEFYITSNKFSVRERKTKRGKVYDAVFRIVDKDTGKISQKTLGGYSTKSAAKTAYNEYVAEFGEFVRQNPFGKKKTVPEHEEPSIKQLCEEYLRELRPYNKESVIYDKMNIYARYVYPKIGDKKQSEIDKNALMVWQDELAKTKADGKETSLSPKYIHKIRGHLSSMFKWANDKYGYSLSFEGIRKPVVRKRKDLTYWSKEEFEQFIEVVDDEKYKMLFNVMFYTGRRQGEIFALSKADVKPDEILWNKSLTKKTLKDKNGVKAPYKITSTKEDKVQRLPTAPELREKIEEYKGEEPFYFGGEKPLSPTTVIRKFYEYTDKAKLPRIRIHDLRHSFASRLLKNGENVLVIAELIGDTPEQVIKTYCHINKNDLTAALNRF